MTPERFNELYLVGTPDDFGVQPTNDPSVQVLWERYANEVGMSFVVEDDLPPDWLFTPPLGLERWWDEQRRAGGPSGIVTAWTDR